MTTSSLRTSVPSSGAPLSRMHSVYLSVRLFALNLLLCCPFRMTEDVFTRGKADKSNRCHLLMSLKAEKEAKTAKTSVESHILLSYDRGCYSLSDNRQRSFGSRPCFRCRRRCSICRFHRREGRHKMMTMITTMKRRNSAVVSESFSRSFVMRTRTTIGRKEKKRRPDLEGRSDRGHRQGEWRWGTYLDV